MRKLERSQSREMLPGLVDGVRSKVKGLFLKLLSRKLDDRVGQRNLKFLRSPEVNPIYREAFLTAYRDEPQLKNVEILFSKAVSSGEFRINQHNAGPKVVLAPYDERFYTELIENYPETASTIARMNDSSLEDFQARPEKLAAIIVLHELGHALEYIEDYYNNPLKIDPRRSWIRDKRKAKESLPLPGILPSSLAEMLQSGELDKHFIRNQRKYLDQAILFPADLVPIQEREYRRLPAERFADRFSAKNFKKMDWDKLAASEQPEPKAA